LLIPGFSSGSKRISDPESVTADRILLALTAGSSSSQTQPLPPMLFDICFSTSWRS
jgi:hypothetical protein